MFLFVSDNHADWQLAQSRVDIWRFRLDIDPSSLPRCLSATEIKRANRFHFAKHQRRFRVARTSMRTILARYLDQQPTDITFEYGQNGKPSIISKKPIRFNLSHTGDYACLAVGLETDLGIDVEHFSAREYLGIAKHVFSRTEETQLKSIPDYMLPLAFFSLWSQKEAAIKCNGLGMRYPLKQLTLPPFSEPGHQFIDVVDQAPRQLFRFTPYLCTAAALCCHQEVSDVHLFDWHPDHR